MTAPAAPGRPSGPAPIIQVFLGTKAQYIKTAPLLRLLDQRGIEYRLIDSGQHGALSVGLRDELGVRDPDQVLGDGRDVDTIPQAIAWAARLATRLVDGGRLRREVFGGRGGICVVHGDTPSTLLSTLMARRAGLHVAHLEAGLRSHKVFDPFPEEAIRLVVMRLAHLLFAPDQEAVTNLAHMKVRGEVVRVAANTVVEAAAHALAAPSGGAAGRASDRSPGRASDAGASGQPSGPIADGASDRAPGGTAEAGPGSGPAIVTMHRVENLKQAGRVRDLVDLVVEVARAEPARPIRFVTHGPTIEQFSRTGDDARLREAGVEVLPLQPHGEFVRMLAAAPWVITDGGSIQEECALLGVPTLLWRQRSERPDGIGRNVVVSGHDLAVARSFLADPERHRVPRSIPGVAPSQQVLEVLLRHLDGVTGPSAARPRAA